MAESAHRGEPFRLALLDVMMPGMDGFQLTERIRRDARLAHCTVLLLSSAGQLEEAGRCAGLGIARYLIKPVKHSDLRDALVRALGASADLLRKTVKVFLAESGKLVPAIRQAIEQGEAPGLRRLAHSLEGSADCFAADAAVAAAFRLEMMGRAADLAEAGEASPP